MDSRWKRECVTSEVRLKAAYIGAQEQTCSSLEAIFEICIFGRVFDKKKRKKRKNLDKSPVFSPV